MYLDDVMLLSYSYEVRCEDLEKVFQMLQEAGVSLKLRKCALLQKKVE